jgi:mannosyltransferase
VRLWSPGGVALAASAICLLLGTYRLGRQSLWFDELISLYLSTTDWISFWRTVSVREANMVLYYILLRFWVHVGSSEFAIRALSVAFSVAAIPMVFLLGRRLFGARVGAMASVLLAVNAFNIKYSQEARSYTLVLLLITAASLLFIRAMENPSVRNWAWYCLAASAAFYAHLFTILVIIAHFGCILLLPNWRSLRWKRYIIAGLAICLLDFPLVLFIKTHNSGQLSWVTRPTIHSLYVAFDMLTGSAGVYLISAYLILLVFAAWNTFRAYGDSRQEAWKWLLLIVWFVFPIACILTFSFLRRPVFVPRYLIMCLPPLVLLAAAVISSLRRQAVQVCAFAALLVLSCYGTYNYYQQDNENEAWRSATSFVAAKAVSGDGVIFFHPAGWLGLHYYWNQVSQSPMPFVSMFPASFSYPRLLSGGPIGPSEEWVRTSTGGCTRMWVVISEVDPASSAQLQGAVTFYYPSMRLENEFHGVTVILYDQSGLTRAVPDQREPSRVFSSVANPIVPKFSARAKAVLD